MRKLIMAGIILAMLVLAVPAEAISTPPGYLHPTPCARQAAGYPVFEHLRYWANQGWVPWNSWTIYTIWRRTDSGLICRVYPI
jgi:hypothetical protein